MSPYITTEARAAIDTGALIETKGELTYVLYRMMLEWLKEGPNNFDRRADAIAAVECAKLEFYRRIVAPYEDQKIAENGDVR